MAKNKRRDDPIADYVEWTEHRYDPGYYLGGNLPPHLRKSSLGPAARRRAGLLLGVMAFITLSAVVSELSLLENPSIWGPLLGLGFVVLTTTAAIRMFRAGREHPAAKRSIRRDKA